ncbi:MAG: polysaccharide deacetylase family protein [Bacteroidetes bacterium]|nr:polysaccharide deacetylase family protein [Bacteroidota bacterium]MBK8658867.1 polysaccharide deacetylase family protein [Bacteroidota bacterium]
MNYIEQKILGLFVKTKGMLSAPLLSGLGHIFMLHRVLPESLRNFCTINKDLAITPDHLESCLDYLSEKGYRFISLDELHQILVNKKKVNEKFICLTLDDGYLDNLIYAYPLLKKRQIPFTVYVTNCFPNRTGVLWWYWLEKYMARESFIKVSKQEKCDVISWIDFDDAKEKFHLIRKEILSMTHMEYIHFCKTELKLNDSDIEKDCSKNALSWTELLELSKDPLVTIGAHTMNHIALAAQNMSVLRYEIEHSKVELEEKLSKKVEHFAYPYGSFAEAGLREYEIVKEVGFKTATINYPGNIFYQSNSAMMNLPRMPLGNTTTKEKLDYILTGINHYSYNGFSKTPSPINAA